MDNKYELIPSDIEGLFRIKALKDFNDVKKGDIGGYVEGEKTFHNWVIVGFMIMQKFMTMPKSVTTHKFVVMR